MNPPYARLRAHWGRLSRREQAVLAGGMLVLCSSLFIAMVWLPVSQALTRAESALPQLRADMEAFGRDRELFVALKGQASSVRLDAAGAQAAAREAARKAGIDPAVVRVEQAGEGKVRVAFSQVAFAAWLAWTERLHREQKMFVESARVDSLPQSGTVKVEVILSVGNAL